ncbi:BnaC02g23490D [Brassica napus]|uniref:BnaC02g23490D protein n=1 Tax=Brassica napus TaxID=3708 RepID=A0A078FMJ8_BRANA|nr:BnaC02g23490D [Brassica napus]
MKILRLTVISKVTSTMLLAT